MDKIFKILISKFFAKSTDFRFDVVVVGVVVGGVGVGGGGGGGGGRGGGVVGQFKIPFPHALQRRKKSGGG